MHSVYASSWQNQLTRPALGVGRGCRSRISRGYATHGRAWREVAATLNLASWIGPIRARGGGGGELGQTAVVHTWRRTRGLVQNLLTPSLPSRWMEKSWMRLIADQ